MSIMFDGHLPSSLLFVSSDHKVDMIRSRPTTHDVSFQDSTGYLLAMVGKLSRQRWVSMLDQFDINPSQYKVLISMAELGSLCQRRLAEVIGIDPRNCVPIIDSLAQRGLVARRVDSSDRRQRVLALTKKGQQLTRDLAAIGDTIDREVLHPLSRSEQVRLRRMLVEVLGHAQS
jgi:DNA-binding MarR family transcriptional regulator